MKKLISFCIFFVILFICFITFINREKSYTVEYKLDGYKIVEKYNKKDKYYYFIVSKDDDIYKFSYKNKYSTKRELVNKVKVINNDDYTCVGIKVDDYQAPYICNKDKELVDPYYLGELSNKKGKEKIVNQIHIYEKGNYFIWNGYGFTDINKNKKYNFLKKESYDNKLSYVLDNKIYIADYDQTREFNKFYIFDTDTKEIDTLELDVNLSFNTYFMGDKDNFIYLFDVKNKKQYRINLKKKILELVSEYESCTIYDNGWDNIPINKCIYKNKLFNEDKFINYTLDKGSLYYNYINIKDKILVDKGNITSIILVRDDKVYYLKDDSVFSYSPYEGTKELMEYFEWNFSYNNKIFIF